mmetsp:Transcript_5668/g.16852  ORF Transcript_5668/g.16852 Transcript_5668/m.16852 type:complete len:512 (+) Transcript_5668:223-1758(+)
MEWVERAAAEARTDMDRIDVLNSQEPRKNADYVLWWPTECPRTAWNDTFELAKTVANTANLPLICVFAIDLEFYAMGSIRHINFFLEGLDELGKALLKRGSKLFVRFDPKGAPTALSILGDDSTNLKGFGRRAYAVITDSPHLKRSSFVMNSVASRLDCPVIAVDSSVVVPIPVASPDGQLSAPDVFIRRWLNMYTRHLEPRPDIKLQVRADPNLDMYRYGFPWQFVKKEWQAADWLREQKKLKQILGASGVDPNVAVLSSAYRGGEASARKLVSIFVTRKLESYGYASTHFGETKRGEYGSLLSPYLNFGYISPIDICARAVSARKKESNFEAFMSKLALREYAYNRAVLLPHYDQYGSIDEDARRFIDRSIKNRRKRWYYSDEMWERAITHDSVWNGIQRELLFRGRNILNDRNIWCYKIIEFEEDPLNAFRLARKLNDKYMLDALGPIGYHAVVNCFETYANYLDEKDRQRFAGPRCRPNTWSNDAQTLTLSQVFSETAMAVFRSAFY